MKIEIREAYGEWALDIEMPDRIQVIYFTSKQNALNVKRLLETVDRIIEVDNSKPNCATVCDMQEVVRCKDCKHSRKMTSCDYSCVVDHRLAHNETDFCSYGERKECTDQKPVTNFECFKTNIAKMSIDELAKIIKDSDNCEKFCVFTKDGRCDSRGDADVCEIGVKRYLESEVQGE